MSIFAKLFVMLCASNLTVELACAREDSLENMAAISIPYSLRICELENDPVRRENIAKRLSRHLFSYWYESRKLGVEVSAKVDRMIGHVYAVSIDEKFPLSGLIERVLRDPLDALDEESRLKVKAYWKFSSKAEYRELVKEFRAFLRATQK